MKTNPSNPQDWLALARKDILRVEKRVQEADNEDAAFHLQQAAEKAMKGVLIACGWQLRKTHNLPELLDNLSDYKIDCEAFRETSEVLAGQYLSGRYPGAPCDELSNEEMLVCLRHTKALVSFLVERTDFVSKGMSVLPEQLTFTDAAESLNIPQPPQPRPQDASGEGYL